MVPKVYGDRVIAELSARPVMCAGFTMGGAAAMSRYARSMARENERYLRPILDEVIWVLYEVYVQQLPKI